MRAIIVDDEKKGRETLQNLIAHYCKEVDVIGLVDNVENAYTFIVDKQPDLVFLDVEMPKGSGFELLKKFDHVPFKTIFVTAHSHYAIKAIKFSAIDYLLKPVDVDELMQAVERVNKLTAPTETLYANLIDSFESGKSTKIAVPIKDGFAFIDTDDIIRMEADGSYTHIFTATYKYTASKNMKEYEDLLSDRKFFRAHHSHLVNLNHVKNFSRTDGYFAIMSDSSSVEISRRKKDLFLQLMNG